LSEKKLHIVSFNVPSPADYGGIIDVYNKIRCLADINVGVILHSFTYGRKPSRELESICQRTYYYERNTNFLNQFSFQPYIIKSRDSTLLLSNLNSDSFPVLFEGLHTTSHLGDPSLKSKIKIVRTHNIEHEYYFKLSHAEKSIRNRSFHFIEAIKLYYAEKQLRYADKIAAISITDQIHFDERYKNSFLLPPFHSEDIIDIVPGMGKYILFHGNLSVAENIKAADYLIDNVFSKIDFPVIIAGKDPDATLYHKVAQHSGITIIDSPSAEEMKGLIKNSHANVLITFQKTGIKLKLIESLFAGRFCIVNGQMTENTGLESLCLKGDTPEQLILQINSILQKEFSDQMIEKRKDHLKLYDNRLNAKKLADFL
jgi:hypothetical protein